jgi:hypothetical protein
VTIVPFLCLTAAVLIDRLAEHVGTISRRPWAPGISATVLAVAVGAPSAARAVEFDQLLSRTDTRVRAAQWIEARFPAGATMYQTGIFYAHVEPRPLERYAQSGFDRLPDIIVVLDSPLVLYNDRPSELAAVLDASYVEVATFRATPYAGSAGAVYDQQDAFYVPFGGLTRVQRPGPDIRVFERTRPSPAGRQL